MRVFLTQASEKFAPINLLAKKQGKYIAISNAKKSN